MKVYTARPEFISKYEMPELYEAEEKVTSAFKKVLEIRVEKLKEDYWKEALPQTLRTLLEGWDKKASTVAAKSFLSGEEEKIEA